MTITTQDGALAGMQYPRKIMKGITPALVAGRHHSLFYLPGIPGAGVAPTPGIGGEVLTTLSGQIPYSNPVSGNSYLARFSGQAGQAGVILLCDRLFQNSGIDPTLTTEQVFTGAAQIPARDANGTNAGAEVFAALEVSAVMGAAVPTITFKYNNSLGVADKTGQNIVPTTTASPQGTFHVLALAAGDVGVQKAQSIQFSVSWLSGTCHLILFRILDELEITVANVGNAHDMFMTGFSKLPNNIVPFIVFIPSTTSQVNVAGSVIWTQG